MARRRPQGGGKPRRSAPYAGSVHQNPVRRQQRRRSALSRMSTRGATLLILGTAVAAIAGVAVAGAITSNGGTKNTASNTPSPPPVSSPSPSPSGPLGPVLQTPAATHSPSPAVVHTPSPKPTPTRTVAPQVTSSPSPSATLSPKPPATTSSCPTSPTARVAAARRLLQHTSALPNATLITAGPRQGLLGASDLSARTLTLYVRNCGDEPTIQLAVVWGYEAGQFIPVQTWSSSTVAQWARLRGISGTPSQTLLRQDAASVYAFWQTGSTRYWQSPIALPSASQLSSLAPYLHTS